MSLLLIIFILSTLAFGFITGSNDSANIVATAIASRAISPRWALFSIGLAEFLGPFIFGVAVASTVGNGIVKSEAVTGAVALAAVFSAIIWNLITRLSGIPSSSSHALIGGFIGAAVTGYGFDVIQPVGLLKTLIGLFLSPLIGFVFGWVIMDFAVFLGRSLNPRSANWVFARFQWVTLLVLGLSYGANDAEKTMGLLAMGLVAFGVLKTFSVPHWVIIACALATVFGTLAGGQRLIRTVGGKFYRIRSIHAFASQIAGSAVILGAALFGAPVSTTQVISSTIVGAGASERVVKVRWGTAQQIASTWILTIPSAMLMGSGIYWLIIRLF